MKKFNIPHSVSHATEILEKAGFKAFLVGGSLRDLVMERKPKDWDITTNATPLEIINLFSKTFYNNKYGTVTVVDEEVKDETLKTIEITPFRLESRYTDGRHPDTVTFTEHIEDDLKRRDFTINAIAYNISQGQIIDPFQGQSDIKAKIIRAVGDPSNRFEEDALRMMRAVRLATELDFTIDTATKTAINDNKSFLRNVSRERIRDEFSKMILSDTPKSGVELLEELSILEIIVPELREGMGIEQNQAHSFDVWQHNLKTLQHAANKKWEFHVRLAALFHDVAKPKTRLWRDEKNDWTFYGHDVVGAKMTKNALVRLKYPQDLVELVSKLVRYHLFFSDVDKITMSAVRRLIKNMGREHIWDLMKVRACDRIGTGRPKEAPYRLRKYESMIEEALMDPISVGMLKIDGNTIMRITNIKPGPKIGYILHALLEEVLDSPTANTKDYLENRAIEMSKLSEKELTQIGQAGKGKKDQIIGEKVETIRKKHWVK